ncbi:WD repeat-containing protein 88-like [Clytia hemisphaerica]|uniref:Uncharacterized protein n=1 Tax=Clytia hemisphaerica TaxID=252671 RepID=A0A7M5WYF7_9CNID|eukprot:TCONS_00060587-protein
MGKKVAEEEGWDHEKLAKVKLKVLRGHIGGVQTCCFLDGQSLVLSGGVDKTLKIWDIQDGSCRETLIGHKAEVTCTRSTKDGRRIVSSGLDKYLIVWDGTTGQPILESRHEGMVMSCDISYDGRYMLSGTDLDNVVVIWDLRQDKSIKMLKHHNNTVMCVRFAPSSYQFCSSGMDFTSVVCDMQNYRNERDPHAVIRLGGHINMISSCDFSGDERRLCTGSWDKTIKVWDLNSGSYRTSGPVSLDKVHEGCVSACRFSKDGSTIMSANYDQSLIMWDADNACVNFTLQGHTGWVTDCDFSADELGVISSSKDGTIRYWDILRKDEIPVVLQNKKTIGLRLLKCHECQKQFSITQAQNADAIKLCVFCRLEYEKRVS